MTVKELIEELSKGSMENEVRIFCAIDETADEEYGIESIAASVGGWKATQIILSKE